MNCSEGNFTGSGDTEIFFGAPFSCGHGIEPSHYLKLVIAGKQFLAAVHCVLSLHSSFNNSFKAGVSVVWALSSMLGFGFFNVSSAMGLPQICLFLGLLVGICSSYCGIGYIIILVAKSANFSNMKQARKGLDHLEFMITKAVLPLAVFTIGGPWLAASLIEAEDVVKNGLVIGGFFSAMSIQLYFYAYLANVHLSKLDRVLSEMLKQSSATKPSSGKKYSQTLHRIRRFRLVLTAKMGTIVPFMIYLVATNAIMHYVPYIGYTLPIATATTVPIAFALVLLFPKGNAKVAAESCETSLSTTTTITAKRFSRANQV